MTSGGWHSQEQRHGRHRRGATGAAWTPAVRPTDSAPAHARHDGAPAFRPADTAEGPAWPASEVLTHRPGWPADPEVPMARVAEDAPTWPAPRRHAPERPSPDTSVPVSRRSEPVPPSFLREPIVGRVLPAPSRRSRHAARAAKRGTVSSDMLGDTVPMGRTAAQIRPETGPLPSAVAYALPETPATGLRKFDLGTVPASVTPPRSWRKAAWFAVGTSAAVILGLTVATTELMGRPVEDGAMIDALPAYPSGPLTLADLPDEQTAPDAPTTDWSTTPKRPPSAGERPPSSSAQDSPPRDTVTGGTTGEDTFSPTDPPSEDTTATPSTASGGPTRTTVGRAPVTPTDPQKMGDVTEQYFQLVTTDPEGAHALTTGGMAREGAEGIEARYGGIERVEVQDITIDRNRAITTSTVRVVHKDGTETVEHRQLTFTWGGDPKIIEDLVTG